MMRAGDFIIKQSKALLENKQQAILFAVLFSILPFASWLSVALVSLVTLRRGAKAGFEVMLPALVVHSVPLMMLVPLDSVLINTLVAYIPCYLGAITLRKTASWQLTLGMFLLLSMTGFLLIQVLAPDFVIEQFNQFKKLITQLQEYKQIVDDSIEGLSVFILAQLFFGFQILSVLVSATVSLMCARSMQARLFMPGGFSRELQEFRSGKLAFLVLVGVSTGFYFEIPFAINLLPIILAYFLTSGFSLAVYTLARRKQIKVVILLLLLILLKPVFMLLAYVVFGVLDSLFNFRLYLPTRVREST